MWFDVLFCCKLKYVSGHLKEIQLEGEGEGGVFAPASLHRSSATEHDVGRRQLL
jgi:hypothetical protein